MKRQTIRSSTGYAAVVTLAAGCAVFGPQLTTWNPAPVGASWEIAQRNTGSYGKDTQLRITRIADSTWKDIPVAAMKNTSTGGTLLMQASDGNWLAMLGPDGKPFMSFEPAIGWMYPLYVGKSWTTRHKMTTHASNQVTDYEMSCQVEEFEKVTVRAGTLDAFRVHCTNSIGNDDIMWSSPEVQPFVKTRLVRGPGSPFGPGTQESELVSRPS
ncbi:MAG TPA: hypothetical protein VN649_19885 [Ramlibacter sp.]|nr:hypothetical protein [Ramlibacter sp.]